jgi:hypothetical protein
MFPFTVDATWWGCAVGHIVVRCSTIVALYFFFAVVTCVAKSLASLRASWGAGAGDVWSWCDLHSMKGYFTGCTSGEFQGNRW